MASGRKGKIETPVLTCASGRLEYFPYSWRLLPSSLICSLGDLADSVFGSCQDTRPQPFQSPFPVVLPLWPNCCQGFTQGRYNMGTWAEIVGGSQETLFSSGFSPLRIEHFEWKGKELLSHSGKGVGGARLKRLRNRDENMWAMRRGGRGCSSFLPLVEFRL